MDQTLYGRLRIRVWRFFQADKQLRDADSLIRLNEPDKIAMMQFLFQADSVLKKG